jgi:hypothetical protein
MKITAIIIISLGILGVFFFGIQAMNQNTSINIFGSVLDISAFSWLPIVVSIILLIGGILLLAFTGKDSSK